MFQGENIKYIIGHKNPEPKIKPPELISGSAGIGWHPEGMRASFGTGLSGRNERGRSRTPACRNTRHFLSGPRISASSIRSARAIGKVWDG